jgi:hypothetical protein
MAISTPTTAGQVLTSAYLNNNINSGYTYISTSTLTAQGAPGSPFQVTGVFSSTYDEYLIIASLYGSANSFCNLQYLIGTTAQTGADYAKKGWYQTGTTLAAYAGTGENQHFFAQYGSTSATNGYTIATCFSPNRAVRTGINIRNVDMLTSETYDLSGQNTLSSQFTGFQLTANSGNMTGTIKIYGVRKI